MFVARLHSTACFTLKSRKVPTATVSNVVRTPAPDVEENRVSSIVSLDLLLFFPGIRRRVLEQVGVWSREFDRPVLSVQITRTVTVHADAPSAVPYHVRRG
jgi:hypothetical protein